MNYNPRMGFNEQDYHLLKTHQSSGGKPEYSTNSSLVLEKGKDCIYIILSDCVVEGTMSFTTSPGLTVRAIQIDDPTIYGVSKMTIAWSTSEENGSRGQIQWAEGLWQISTTGTYDHWTLTLPSNFTYKIIKIDLS